MPAASTFAFIILSPFIAIFAYAAWHEYKRYKEEGPSEYGLSYDPETNTTTVGPIAAGDESFDPDDFDADLFETEAEAAEDGEADGESEAAAEDEPDSDTDTAPDTDHPDADDSTKERRT